MLEVITNWRQEQSGNEANELYNQSRVYVYVSTLPGVTSCESAQSFPDSVVSDADIDDALLS